MRRTLASASSLVVAGLVAACGGAQDSDTTTTPTPIEAEPAAEPTTPPAEIAPATPAEPAAVEPVAAPTPDPAVIKAAEADVAAYLNSINQLQIDGSKIAAKKAKNKEIKAFAKMISDDHTAAKKSGEELYTRATITPAEGDVTRAGAESGKGIIDSITAVKKGADFDKAYIEGQIAIHQQAIATIDEKALPSIQNPELKSFIENLRPTLAKHLEQAQALQAKIATP